MSVTRIAVFTIVGMMLGTLVAALVASYWSTSTVTTNYSTALGGMPVHVTEVAVSGPVFIAELIGAIAGAIAGCVVAVVWRRRR
jgi:hypothetical protein